MIEQEPPPQQPASTRSSRRGKKDIEIPIEKQEDIVLNKKTRTGRGKKPNQPITTDNPITVVDVVMTSVTVSVNRNILNFIFLSKYLFLNYKIIRHQFQNHYQWIH